MKIFNKPLSESTAKTCAKIITFVCFFSIFSSIFSIFLSVIGRQVFTLHTDYGTYEYAMYSGEKNRDEPISRGPITSPGEIVVTVYGADEKIDFITQAGLVATNIIYNMPLLICFWLLSRVTRNINKGLIFTVQNAAHLTWFGLISIAAAMVVPYLQSYISWFISKHSADSIYFIHRGSLISGAIPGFAFIIAAYIIHYGVHLQDEADHTL